MFFTKKNLFFKKIINFNPFSLYLDNLKPIVFKRNKINNFLNE
jgi:hypothetical protein